MNILITGINGRIGKIVENALSSDCKIYGIDKAGEQKENIFILDMSDFSAFNDVFAKLPKLDCIIHLAADSHPDSPHESVLQNNIIATVYLYECARLHSVPKVIFASTNRVTQGYEGEYGFLKDGIKQISIQDPIRTANDYGVSKVFGETLARMYNENFNIHSVCLRIGSVLADDNPIGDVRHMKTWLSHKDLTQLIRKSVESKIHFGIYYGVSNNREKFWDISNANEELGYCPEDDAHKLIV